MLHIRMARLHYIRVVHHNILCTVRFHNTLNNICRHTPRRPYNLFRFKTIHRQRVSQLPRLPSSPNQRSHPAKKGHFSSNGTD